MAVRECKTREYKQDISSPAKIMRSIVAFANSAGGHVVIGVDDGLRVVGVPDPLREEERLANLIADWIEPRLVPGIELSTVDGRTVLVVDVSVSGRRPHYIRAEGARGGVYVRLGASNRKADPALIAELERGRRGEFFDKLPVPTMTVDDLDIGALSKMLKREMNDSALRTLSLITTDQGRLVPTNGGVLIAGKFREEIFPFAWAQCARFRGPERLDMFDQIEVHAHLPRIVDEAMAFLTKHAFKTAEFGGIRRNDVYSIPVSPLREIIVNAVAHASYSGAHSPIRVAFMDDRIEVDNPGGLMPGLTVSDIVNGVSEIRNPVLARVFSEMNLMEEWGTGLKGVVKALAEGGLPAPEFVELPGRLRVVIHIANHQPVISPRPGTTRGAQARHEDVREDVREDASPRLSKNAVTILSAALEAGQLGRGELLAAAGILDIYGNYRRNITPLVRAGLLAMTEPGSPRSTTQSYRVTPEGREYLTRASREQ
jgi:predicted HTH transcriptional regulator